MNINNEKIIQIIACLSVEEIILKIDFFDFSYKNLFEELKNLKIFIEKIIFDDLIKNIFSFYKIESIYLFKAYKHPS